MAIFSATKTVVALLEELVSQLLRFTLFVIYLIYFSGWRFNMLRRCKSEPGETMDSSNTRAKV